MKVFIYQLYLNKVEKGGEEIKGEGRGGRRGRGEREERGRVGEEEEEEQEGQREAGGGRGKRRRKLGYWGSSTVPALWDAGGAQV